MFKIYLFNSIITLLVLIFMKFFKKDSSYILCSIIFVIPIVGIFMTLSIYICKSFIKSDYGKDVLNREKVYENKISLLIREAELKQKKDIIPMEDAFVLNSNSIKRRLIKDIIKKDFNNNLKILNRALDDKDTETSHYAATAITELKSRLLILLQKGEDEYNKDSKNSKIIINYLEIIQKCIDSKFFDISEDKKLEYKYIEILKNYISTNKKYVDEKYFKELIKTYIKIEQYCDAVKYANKYKQQYKYSINPHLLLLEIYYKNKDKDEFNKTLIKLKEAKIALDQDSLEVLKFWGQGNLYV